jgi:phosphoribosylglycinamide formyltransferase-1
MPNLAVLVSGTGSILKAMIAQKVPIALVLADRPCRALDIAQAAGVTTKLTERSSFGRDFDRDGYTKQVIAALRACHTDLVALSGFMTLLAAPMFDEYPGRVLNIYPSLLPAFKGDQPVRDALAYGVKLTGCTVHIVTPSRTPGRVIAQAAVTVHAYDTVESLHERIKTKERELYPATIKKVLTTIRD